MTNRKLLVSLISGLLLFSVGVSTAKDWSKEQLEVWDTVLESYKDIDARDANWSDKWVFPDAMVWGPSYPMPRNRDSIKRWDRYQFARGKNHVTEYSPVAIVVHDSTAVAHYYSSSASEDADGKHEVTHGRCTDVLARDGKRWKFIAWHCGNEPSDD